MSTRPQRRSLWGARPAIAPAADDPAGTPTHCPYCALQCGMTLVDGTDETVVAPRDFPTNAGGLCRKGWTSAALLRHPERLRAPLVRERRGGALVETTWTDAIARTARGLADAQGAHGPDAAGVFGGGGHLFDIGTPPAAVSIADMPDDTQICNCNGVSKGAIAACAMGGASSVGAVMKTTRAGTGCGSCKDQVCEIVEWAAGDALVEDPSAHYYVPGVPLPKAELVDQIRSRDLRSASQVFEALAGGRDDPASKMGLTSLLRTIWGADELGDERDARYINDRVHANIQRDGTFSVVPGISGGVTSADQLRRIADVADKYGVPMIKITGGQRIDLLGIAKDDLPGVWNDLGMRSGHAYGKSFRTVKSCVGTDFCRFGVGDAIGLGVAMEDRFKGIEAPAKLKLAVAGCPRNCSEAMVKDVGAVAVEGGRWEIYVGGAAGAHVRKGDVLCTVDSHEESCR